MTASRGDEKDEAYRQRNVLVAALSRLYPSGIRRTTIEGWSEDWHGCVYIDLPAGQISYHYHDSQAPLFAGLPPYTKAWDNHTKADVEQRLSLLSVTPKPADGAIEADAQCYSPDDKELLLLRDEKKRLERELACKTAEARTLKAILDTEREAALSATARLHVTCGRMDESNGRATWAVFLGHSADAKPWDCHQVYADEIEGRALYEAAKLRHFLGQGPEPDILAFNTSRQADSGKA